MGMNFNIVQKPKKTDDDEEKDELLDEDELEVEETKTKTMSSDKRKLYRLMGIAVAIFIGFILLILILSSITNSNRKYSYSEIEKIMKNAAISYFKDNKNSLPVEDGDITEIDAANLTAAGKMKDLSEYLKEGDACTGSVQVEKTSSGYLYTPYLNCGDNYSTVELANKVLENEEIVTSGYGLYSTKYGHIFRGENVNNYVQLDNNLWRIVKITSNNNVVLISEEGAGYTKPWDNRYNPERLYESGVNTYSNSRIKDYLDKLYNNPSEKEGENILSSKDKKRIVPFNVCISKRLTTSESKDNSVECSEVLKDQKLGLLTLSDYMFASIDENCKNSTTKSCKNYNYLTIKKDWWLVTGNKEDTSTVFQVASNGSAKAVNASNYAEVRPVIYLNEKTLYKSGNGTLEKPYKVR